MSAARDDARQEGKEEGGLLTRRRFLGYVSGVLGAVIGAALGLPLARFYAGNTFKARERRWIKLGQTLELSPGRPELFRAAYIDRDGWRQLTRRQAFYAVAHEGRELTVFSHACTHLGCPVRWDDKTKLFLCPCHNGGFSINGEVVKGPPPRPLDRMEHKVEQGVLYVRVEEA